MYDNWEDLEQSIKDCKKCKLCTNRTNIVFGVGNKNADVMFIGEGPGADERDLSSDFASWVQRFAANKQYFLKYAYTVFKGVILCVVLQVGSIKLII